MSLNGRNKNSKGFIEVEILLSLLIIAGAVVSCVELVLAEQTTVTSSEFKQQAQQQAENILQSAYAESGQNFNQIANSPIAAPWPFNSQLEVSNISPCAKQVAAEVFWQYLGQTRTYEAENLLVSPQIINSLGADCELKQLKGDWQNPQNLTSFSAFPAGTQVTDIDALNQIVFVAASNSSPSLADFFVFDASNALAGNPPQLLYSLDTGKGINALDATLSPAGDFYIYVAAHETSKQFKIIKLAKDLTQPPQLIAEASLNNVDPAGDFPQARSIFYYDNKVYIGTRETAGNEFHIFSVANPFLPKELGNIQLKHSVYDIAVMDNKAYLATTANNKELIVLNVSSPTAITEAGSFDAPGSQEAKSVSVLGQKVYLGRQKGTDINPDFFILDSQTMLPLFSTNTKQSILADYISSIKPSGNMVFLTSTDKTKGLLVLDFNNSASPIIKKFNLGEFSTGLDLENNLLYTVNQKNAGLRITKAGQ